MMRKATEESIKISRIIQKFLNVEVLQARTESINTFKSLKNTLTLYLTFLEDQKKVSPSTLSAKCFEVSVIKEWLIWLHNSRGCSPGTCNTRLACLRTFLGYMAEEDIEYLNLNLAASTIPRMKSPKKKVKGLSSKALKTIFSSPNPYTRTGRRDYALMILLYSTAARINEVLSLKMSQLNLDSEKPFIRFIGKGNKLRTIYLLPETVEILKEYIKEFHGDDPDKESVLFYSSHKDKYTPITETAVNKMLKKYAAKAHQVCSEVPLGLHAHQFRHARASHWLEEGLNIVQISLLLGHENVETTMVYLDVTLDQKAEALSSLENETQKQVKPKWKNSQKSLAEFCGL